MVSFSVIYLHQGGKRLKYCMFAHYSFLSGGGLFLLPPKLPLGIKVDFVGRVLHIPKGEKKKNLWMGILYLSTFGHLTSFSTACKTAVPELACGKKEKEEKKIYNRIISSSETQLAMGAEKNKSQSKLQHSMWKSSSGAMYFIFNTYVECSTQTVRSIHR